MIMMPYANTSILAQNKEILNLVSQLSVELLIPPSLTDRGEGCD